MYACVRGVSLGVGMQSLLNDFGIDVPVHVFSDSSAARGTIEKRGLGKSKHIAINHLWLQDAFAKNLFKLSNIPTKQNPADAMTKHLTGTDLHRLCAFVGLFPFSGRALSAPVVDS